MMNLLKIFCLASALVLASCAHSVHQVHVSDFRPKAALEAGEVVKAETSQFVVLGFVGQTDYVEQAYVSLQKKCENGQLSSITTEHLTSLGFLSWTNKIRMHGLCLRAN